MAYYQNNQDGFNQFLPQDSQDQWLQILNNYFQLNDVRRNIEEEISKQKTRFTIDLDQIRNYDKFLADTILKQPQKAIEFLTRTLNQQYPQFSDISSNDKKKHVDIMNKQAKYNVTFEGNLGANLITPKGLTSRLANQYVGVQGVVTRISIVKPKLGLSAHYCEATEKGEIHEYQDEYDLTTQNLFKRSRGVPAKDMKGNPLTTEIGFCRYKDFQTLLLQEMPEKTSAGTLPKSIEIILHDDLVDKIKPGDRIQVNGVYKILSNSQTAFSGIFSNKLVATSFHILQETRNYELTSTEIDNIKSVVLRNDLFEVLSQSIAPSIQGHEFIKKAILLMLLGGVEKKLENGTHLRGDINVLMVGDPSTAKSQLLRRVMSVAPLAISTTGKGTSGVGLTAAVVTDKDTGERHLAAGAMVMGDKGIVCIDEFDKMNEEDRVAIHEVMEQQTVTISKAGIHTSLNARCSVIAAANPIYGEYQVDLPPTKNIGLPDSLLSRFDLLFIVLDEKKSEIDRLVAERVVKNHMYRDPKGDNTDLMGNVNDEDDYMLEQDLIDENDTKNDKMFEKSNNTFFSNNQKHVLTQTFLKKFISYSKNTFKPIIQDDAIELISTYWTYLRKKDLQNNSIKQLPITIRTLETLIRIATAHAKMRHSNEVRMQDAKVAKQLLNFALFGEQNNEFDEDDEDHDDSMIDEDEQKNVQQKKTYKGRRNQRDQDEDYIDQGRQTRQQRSSQRQQNNQDSQDSSITRNLRNKLKISQQQKEQDEIEIEEEQIKDNQDGLYRNTRLRSQQKEQQQQKEIISKQIKIKSGEAEQQEEVDTQIQRILNQSVEIRQDQQSYLFRIIQQNAKSDKMIKKDLLSILKRKRNEDFDSGYFNDEVIMDRCLLALEDNGRVIIQDDEIYLI